MAPKKKKMKLGNAENKTKNNEADVKETIDEHEDISKQTGSTMIFILIGLSVVVVMVAVVYSNDEYQNYVRDIVKKQMFQNIRNEDTKNSNLDVEDPNVVSENTQNVPRQTQTKMQSDNFDKKENIQNESNVKDESELGGDSNLKSEVQHDSNSKSDTHSEKQTHLKLDSDTQKQDDPKSNTRVQSQSDSNLDTRNKQKSDSNLDSQNKQKRDSNLDSQNKQKSDSNSDIEKQMNSDSGFGDRKDSDSKLDLPNDDNENLQKVKKSSDKFRKENELKSKHPNDKDSESRKVSSLDDNTHAVPTKNDNDADKSRSEENIKSDQTDEKKTKQKESVYEKMSVTNTEDYKFRDKLDDADRQFDKGNLEEALQSYDGVLEKHPNSPRAFYGKAETLDKMAERQRSNVLLEEAISSFQRVLDAKDVPGELLIKAGIRLADRLQFRGWGGKASKTLKFLSSRFPENVDIRKKLGVSYLIIGQVDNSKQVFEEVLRINSSDGFAKVHLGFIIKTGDNNPEKAIPLLKEGIESNEEGTQDGRFFFHLGDAYQRLRQPAEAYKLYEEGAQKGLFLSAYQRSLYNVDHLTGKPWWKPEETGYQSYLKMLEENWRIIKEEGMAQLDMKTGGFLPEEENLREKGDWKQLTLYQQGRKNKDNCARTPKTCELIDKVPDAKGCKRGQVKFSVMHPGVHVWPHCGPTNCRIRAHLGLIVPKGPRIRVANDTRQWSVGKFIIFDDSFEHEVWHNGTDLRLVLIVDFWHPELTAAERRNLTPI